MTITISTSGGESIRKFYGKVRYGLGQVSCGQENNIKRQEGCTLRYEKMGGKGGEGGEEGKDHVQDIG